MRPQCLVRFALILFVIGIFGAVTLHAQTSTQSTTDSTQTTTTDSTQTTTQQQTTTSTQGCNMPCAPQALPRTITGSGTSGELYVNAGGIWPNRMSSFDDEKIKAQGVYGLKGALTFASGVGVEASFGYLNQFSTRNTPNFFGTPTIGLPGAPSVWAMLYDINGVWNFGSRRYFGAKVRPYVVGGVGGLTAEVRHGNSAFLQGGGFVVDPAGIVVPNPEPQKIIHDGDTFFTFNYGTGFKAENLWGPIGFRVDVRGRTIPNFYSSSPTWIEATAGLLVSWGER